MQLHNNTTKYKECKEIPLVAAETSRIFETLYKNGGNSANKVLFHCINKIHGCRKYVQYVQIIRTSISDPDPH
jgi:predicted alpha/beta superfamily hydrolase